MIVCKRVSAGALSERPLVITRRSGMKLARAMLAASAILLTLSRTPSVQAAQDNPTSATAVDMSGLHDFDFSWVDALADCP